MTEADNELDSNKPEIDARASDIQHDHSLFKTIAQADLIIDGLSYGGEFVDQGMERFDKLVEQSNKDGSTLALLSHDISAKWQKSKNNEELAEDLKFLISQAPNRYRNPIEYEGIDASENDLEWRKSMDGVGEKVRLSKSTNVHGIDKDESIAKFGDSELTISKAVVRTSTENYGTEESRTISIMEYEFEGHEGRHNAKQFEEAEGRDHAFGVMMVQDERLWLVPFDSNTEMPDPDQPPREIVDYAGKDISMQDPEGIAGVKDSLVKNGPAIGEYYYQPRDGYNEPGPIKLLVSPWQSGTNAKEAELSERAIKEVMASEAPERVHSKGLPERDVPIPDRGIER